MTIALTAELGRFAASVRYEQIPEQAVSSIKMVIADCVGVMIAGARDPAPRIVRTMLAPQGGEATLALDGGRAPALDAAWINGTAAHALDYDDVAQRGGHPSAALVPAILAEAEALGADGRRIVLAYAAGFEVFADMARRDAEQQHEKGWHPTSIFGTLGAAAACASLRRLDPGKATMAIAIGASQSSGLVSNFGTMTKPMHAGLAARAGVASARLAELGFTGAHDALEHAPGLLMAVSPGGRIDVESPLRAGAEWQICGSNRIGIKRYPMCYCVHRALDGVFDLLQKQRIRPEDVERVAISFSPRNVTILRNHAPQTGLEAKFSIEFAIAAALIAGRAGLAELSDEFVRRPDVQALMKRVSAEPNPELDPQRPGHALFDRVLIHTRDGRIHDTGPVRGIRGDPNHPLTREQLWQKFEDCVRAGDPRLDARALFDALMSLERLAHASQLAALLAPPAAGTQRKRA
jgi:2-methylcitrate dehydratase PrpD